MKKTLEILRIPYREHESNIELPADASFLYVDKENDDIKVYYSYLSKKKSLRNVHVCKPSPKMVMLADNDFSFIGSIDHLSIFSKRIR